MMKKILLFLLVMSFFTLDAQKAPRDERVFRPDSVGQYVTTLPDGSVGRKYPAIQDFVPSRAEAYQVGDWVKYTDANGVTQIYEAILTTTDSPEDAFVTPPGPAWVLVDNISEIIANEDKRHGAFFQKAVAGKNNVVGFIGDSQHDLPAFSANQYWPIFTFDDVGRGPGWIDFNLLASDYYSPPPGVSDYVISGVWTDKNLINDVNDVRGLSGREMSTTQAGAYVEFSSDQSYTGAPGVTDVDTIIVYSHDAGTWSWSYNAGAATNVTTSGLTITKIPTPDATDTLRITHVSGVTTLLGAEMKAAGEGLMSLNFLGHGRARFSQWSTLIKQPDFKTQFLALNLNTVVSSLGTNDARSGILPEVYYDQGDAVFDSLTSWQPGLEIIAISPPQTSGQTSDTITDAYEAEMKKLGSKYGFKVVSVGALFQRKSPEVLEAEGLLLFDDIHYSPTGSNVIGNELYYELADRSALTDPLPDAVTFSESVTTPIVFVGPGHAINVAEYDSELTGLSNTFRVETNIPTASIERSFITIEASGYQYLNEKASRSWFFSGYINEVGSNYFTRSSLVSSTGESLTVAKDADDNFVFYLGDFSGTVSYPSIVINEVKIHRQTTASVPNSWLSGWTISPETGTGTDTFVKEIPNQFGLTNEFIGVRNRQYALLASYTTSSATRTGAFVITTNINSNDEPTNASLMRKMGDIDVLVSEYQKASNRILIKGFLAEQLGGRVLFPRYLSDQTVQVRAGSNANGQIVYIVGDVADTWAYPQVFVNSASFGFDDEMATREFQDWTVTLETDLSAYNNLSAATEDPGIAGKWSTSPATENVDAGGFEVTNAADATTPTALTTLQQVQTLVSTGGADDLGNHEATQDLDMGTFAINWDSGNRFTNAQVRVGDGTNSVTLYDSHIAFENQTTDPLEQIHRLYAKEEIVDGDYENRLYYRTNADDPSQTATATDIFRILTDADVRTEVTRRLDADKNKVAGSIDTEFTLPGLEAESYEIEIYIRYQTNTAGGGIAWNSNANPANSGFILDTGAEGDWTVGTIENATAANVWNVMTYKGVITYTGAASFTLSTGPNGTGDLTIGAGSYIRAARTIAD